MRFYSLNILELTWAEAIGRQPTEADPSAYASLEHSDFTSVPKPGGIDHLVLNQVHFSF
jgi:hypothetical protein